MTETVQDKSIAGVNIGSRIIIRLLVSLTAAFWLGGLTFYAAVVIPVAHEVLGGHREVGFITQRVSVWINIAATVSLTALLLNLIMVGRGGLRRRLLLATWLAMAAAQVALFLLHPALDRLLVFRGHQILDSHGFYNLHRVYLILTIIQQFAGVLHVYFLLNAWSSPKLGE